MLERYFYASDLLPAAPVQHGYRNFWFRDGWYVGLCEGGEVRDRLWRGIIAILDSYKWKLEIHAKRQPVLWYEFIHVRYSPEGKEINEGWLHNQWDAIGNVLEVCIDVNRLDLAELIVDYLDTAKYQRRPAAGAWEDRNTCDAYSLAACIHALSRAKTVLPHKYEQIDRMIKRGLKRLYQLLPYATNSKQLCLSLLGVVWPFNLAGPYRDEIIGLCRKHLQREPFGFIRYQGDSYDGEHFNRGVGSEVPWLLGDLFMGKIEPKNHIWRDRIDRAKDMYGFMPEAYTPENMRPNRNSPLLWAEALYNSLHAHGY